MKRISTMTAFAVVFVLSGCATELTGGKYSWVTIFDGTEASLATWDRLGTANWRIEGGSVIADSKNDKNSAYLVSRKSYSNFQLKVEFWVSNDANSGVFLRCRDPKKVSDRTCYEANIFDTRGDPAFGTGGIVFFANVPVPNPYRTGGKWNTYDITANGPNITVVLNGVTTVELNNKKYKSGPIGLQYGKGVVKFRKVEIRELQ